MKWLTLGKERFSLQLACAVVFRQRPWPQVEEGRGHAKEEAQEVQLCSGRFSEVNENLAAFRKEPSKRVAKAWFLNPTSLLKASLQNPLRQLNINLQLYYTARTHLKESLLSKPLVTYPREASHF